MTALPLSAAVAGDQDGPIQLSNADVARLHAQEAQAGTQPAPTQAAARPTDAAPSDAEIAAQQAEIEADLKRRLDLISQKAMGSVERTLDRRVLDETPDVSARPMYVAPAALPAAPAPGGDMLDGAAEEATESEPNASLGGPSSFSEPEPACIYGARGHLLFAPEGRACAQVRQQRASKTVHRVSAEAKTASTKAATKRAAQVGCVYGSRGQLLYASPGVECAG